jgi:hypothetical protein
MGHVRAHHLNRAGLAPNSERKRCMRALHALLADGSRSTLSGVHRFVRRLLTTVLSDGSQLWLSRHDPLWLTLATRLLATLEFAALVRQQTRFALLRELPSVEQQTHVWRRLTKHYGCIIPPILWLNDVQV